MGDSRRFHLFAQFIARNFPSKEFLNVADVAGGKGHLNAALKPFGYKTITFDKARKQIHRAHYQRRFFDAHVKEQFDLLVGMHPDGATDIIILEASKRGIPFAIVPCCAINNVSGYFGSKNKFNDWVAHLRRFAIKLGFKVDEGLLPMNGKNLILIGRRKA